MVSFEADVNWGRAVWVGFGIALLVVVAWVLQSFVGTFVFALFIYYSTRRVYAEILDRVGQPSVSAGLALGALALPVVLLMMYATAISLQELQEFGETTDLGPVYDAVRPYLNVTETVENPRSLLDNTGLFDAVREGVGRATGYLGVIATALLHLFVMFAAAFYLLRDDDRLARWVSDLGDHWGIIEVYAVEVDESLEKIFAGNILNAVVTGTVGAITYSLLNFAATDPVAIPYPALVGLIAGIASLIPVVGMKIVYVPVALYLAVRAAMDGSGWGFVGLFAVVSFVIVDVIPDLVVRPYVSGGTLHTGSLMFAYILGPLLFGWYGLFLGPVILVFVTHFARIVVPELLSAGHLRPAEEGPSHPAEPSAGATAADASQGKGVRDRPGERSDGRPGQVDGGAAASGSDSGDRGEAAEAVDEATESDGSEGGADAREGRTDDGRRDEARDS